MDAKMVIFGCGKLGHEALNVLGSENIACFCDNSPTLIGSEQYGKQVVSFEKLKESYSDAAVIICANARFGNAWAMAQQCEENGVKDYFFWQSVRERDFFSRQAELLSYLNSSINRKQLKSEMYLKRGEELHSQLDYLKRHIDIRHMKPATGLLREWQLLLVETAAELFEKLKELEIKPFLFAGNLLGYVRHNGFIPWDDDIDFALMRDEYEKLRAFCGEHMYTEDEYRDRKNCKKEVREELKDYYWGNGGGDEFNIYRILPDGGKAVVDFFVMDYYASDYTYEALMQMREEVTRRLNNAILEKAGGALYDDEKRYQYFQEAVAQMRPHLAQESEHIYFGIDCMNLYFNFHRGSWIPREVVFPLKEISYEGASFYIPHDAEEFAKFQYRDIWELPDDIGVPQHVGDMLAGEKNW